MKMPRPVPVLALLASFPSLAPAQWNPGAGQWGRSSPNDLRVMTWNVKDAICSTNDKVAGPNNWSAVVRIVAAMKPDMLILQETGDNSGNGTGSTVDSVSQLTTTIGLFLHGGNDPFKPGNPPVTSYVQLYAPGYDLPFVFVNGVTDGFNRNAILSLSLRGLERRHARDAERHPHDRARSLRARRQRRHPRIYDGRD